MENIKPNYILALGYDFLSVYYDFIIKLTTPEKKFRKWLVNEINPQDNESILDFGFGSGQNLILVKRQNQNIRLIGLDIDPKISDIATLKLGKVKIEVTFDLYDGNAFPYPENQFDKVYSCLVFHQLDTKNKQLSLNEIYRVLKLGGKLILADWGKASNILMRLAFCFVQLLDGFKTTKDNVKGKLPIIIEKTGFNNINISKSIDTLIGTFSYFKALKSF